MNLDNFWLEKYDESKIEHKSVVVKLCNDDSVEHYLGNIFYLIEMLEREKRDYKAFIAYYNGYPIGFILLASRKNNGVQDEELAYSILPTYRHQYFGSLLVQEFSEKIFELYPDISMITAYINPDNEFSKKAILLAGYNREKGIKYTQKRL